MKARGPQISHLKKFKSRDTFSQNYDYIEWKLFFTYQ